MPLHLLGKKSWNVYNADNIARVRRDEAEARERELAEEQRMQEIDGERRLAILRGEVPPPLPPAASAEDAGPDGRYQRDARGQESSRDWAKQGGGERRKRKRVGEDDTDFEMRVARERAQSHGAPDSTMQTGSSTALVPHKSSDAPLTDATGHIDLFPVSSASGTGPHQKNAEAEAEKARKRREYEDQYTMRFSNAAGFKTSVTEGPWYKSGKSGDAEPGPEEAGEVGKDAFGNPDPGRRNRDAARIDANDPLAMMKRGAKKVREVERERKVLNEEREREMRRLRKEERRDRKRRREDDDLDGFSLDGPAPESRTRAHGDRRGHDEERRRKHRSSRHDDEDRDRRERSHRSSGRDSERHGHRSEHRHRDGDRRQHSHKDRESRDKESQQRDSRLRREMSRTDHY
ncbi:hypothetical protein JX265_005176 [Neoarthrinium moseri]|uniref:CBF1-interacting co-repressor CIR N-terminal domain-containing protein n=1 Tax=Neoarthrinium moseri TaxID=1658444 RepID=A0A9P9WPM2_9PEZI|nr:hypothetical protein JX265_005176 [Neoarthrinium moseri]